MKTLLLLALASIGLLAANTTDATGTWTGSLLMAGPDGNEMSHPAHVVLKQEGTKLTGTAGPNADEQHEILNGKIEDDVLTFEIQTDNGSMKFNLKLVGDEIKGDIAGDHDGEKRTAKLSLKRTT